MGRCDAAWAALESGVVDRFGWGEAGRGHIRLPIMVSGSGMAAVPVEIEHGTILGPAMVIDVPAALVANLSVGDAFSMWAVVERSDDPLTLAWRDGLSSFDSIPN